MIIAGIDEAGLGPTLGPLVTGSFALHCPDCWTPASPWTELAGAVNQHPQKNAAAITVCDSKLLHPVLGTDGLARTVCALHAVLGGTPVPTPLNANPDAPLHPCYTDGPESSADVPVTDACAAVKTALENAGASIVHYETHVLHEPAFNRVLDSGLNKNQLLLQQTGRHITAIVDAFGGSHPLRIIADKQGGRNSYAAFLAQLYPNAWLRELESGREFSRYRFRPYGNEVEVVFQAKADRASFPTAAASIAAKYVRERAMARLNGWFERRVPGLKPTAGYPQDARRWLADVGGRAAELRVDLLLRNK